MLGVALQSVPVTVAGKDQSTTYDKTPRRGSSNMAETAH
jgi:hypothetical protein